MNVWPTARLSDCCEIVSGGTPKTGVDEYWDGEIPWATPKDLSSLRGTYIHDTPRKITAAGLKSCAASVLPAGSVLLSSRAPIGHVAINTIPMATNQGFKSLVPDAREVEAKYLYWWLKGHRSYLEGLGNGATFKEISKAVVSQVEIPLPPLEEQRRIAEVLDRADELRAKRREALAHLDDLTQSIFLDMFGDPARNPYNWPGVACSEVCKRVTVGIVFQPASYYQPTGVPALRSLNIRPGLISRDNLVYFSSADNEGRLAKTRVWKDDVVLVRTGRPGTAAVIPGHLDGTNAIDILITTPDQEKVDSTFLCSYFNSSAAKNLVLGHKRGQIQEHLNVSSLKGVVVPLPPLELQREFTRRVRRVEELRESHRASLGELDALFASLQDRAFRGLL